MVGFSSCHTNKKIDYKEVICELQNKINEVIKVTNVVIEENNKIKNKQTEMQKLYDFLMDEQGVKLPTMYDITTIEPGTIFRTIDGELKFKKSNNEIKTIQVV